MLSRRIFLNKSLWEIPKSVSCCTKWRESKCFSSSSQHFKDLSHRERMEWNALNAVDETDPSIYRNQLRRNNRNQLRRNKNKELAGELRGNMQLYTGSGVHMPIAHLLYQRSVRSKRSYYFNMPETMLMNYLNTYRKVPSCNSLFLTNLSWANVGGLCSVLVNSVMPIITTGMSLPDGQISIYGPVGTAAYVRKVLVNQFSEQQCNKLWPNFIFTEVSDGALIEDPFMTFKVHELKSTNRSLQPTIMYEFEQPLDKTYQQSLFSDKTLIPKESYDYQVVIVDCPTFDHAKAMFDHSYLTSPPANSNTRRVIIHQSNPQVVQSPMYQEWMESHNNCTHISSAKKENSATHMTPIKAFYRGVCNKVSSHFFPLHGQDNLFDDFQAMHDEGDIINYDQSCTLAFPNNHLNYKLRKLDTVVRGITPQVATMESNVDLPEAEAVYPKLVVLGSGSSSLSHRGQPGYLLQLKEDTSLLIDCGVGTLEQLYNHFNPQQFNEILSSIKVIFISHKHIDHMSGLGTFLQHIIDMREGQNRTEKVIIVAVNPIRKFVMDLYDESVLRKHFRFLSTFPRKYFEISQHFAPVEKLLGVEWFFPVRVEHGPVTHGLVLEVDKWKMVYSADTLPMNSNLIDYGRDADLLIHESTFASNAEMMKARMKMHSFKGGALATADAMNAKNVILTHFNPLFPLVPLVDLSPSQEVPFSGNIFCAMDHLEFSFSQMHLLPNIHEGLLHVFKENCDRYVKKSEKDLEKNIRKSNRLSKTFSKIVDF